MGLFSKLFQSNEKNFVSPMTGKVVAMSDIPDPAFAQKMMGDGCGIELTDGTVVAPFDAKVTAAFPTGHAFGLEAKEDGIEVLIHIGIDTVEMEGEGFSSNIKVGYESQSWALVMILESAASWRRCRKEQGMVD